MFLGVPIPCYMRLRLHTLIHRKPTDVWSVFQNPDNLVQWQSSLKEVRNIEGKPSFPGNIRDLVYFEKGREVVKRERIRYRQEKVALDTVLTWSVAEMYVENRFLQAESGTRWVLEANVRFRGFFWFASLLLAPSIQKQINADMQQFRLLLEKGKA